MMRALSFLLAAPRWVFIAAMIVTALGTHLAAYRLGGAHQFRAGFSAGEIAMRDRLEAISATRTSRQLKDRIHAETHPSVSSADDERLRCGPSTRDCPR